MENTTMREPIRLLLVLLALAVTGPVPIAGAVVRVVTTLPAYAALTREVGGNRVEVSSISRPDEDSHFVKPKPSFALMLQKADLFVTTGLDLELWGPTLVDKSGNREIRDGRPGFVSAAMNVPMLDVPSGANRSAGDIHLYGNPHIHTSPINAKIIAQNIAAGLIRVDPAGRAAYEANLVAFRQRIDVALYGQELVDLLGADVLDPLARRGELIEFLQARNYRGRPLVDWLGGWLGQARPIRGRQIITYHMNWTYFTSLFGLEVVDFVETKPGIPPSARHVHDLIDEIEQKGVRVLLSATYFDPTKPGAIADRTGCIVVRAGLDPSEGQSYFDLVDGWVRSLVNAYGKAG